MGIFRRRRWGRALLIAAGGLLAVLSLAVAGATVFLQGQRLGRIVTGALGGLQGKVTVGAVRWPARALLDLITDTPTPITIDDVTILDPDGTVVLRAPRLAVKVPLRSAIGLRVLMYDLEIGADSLWRFADTKDGSAIGFLAAFAPKPTTKAGKPEKADAKPASDGGLLLQIVNANLDGLTAVFDFPGAWGLELRNVKAPVTFILDGKFVGWDVGEMDARGGGYLKILDDLLPFDRVFVRRVATTRQWPDSIFLDVKAGHTGRSVLTGKGFFTHIYGYDKPKQPPGIDMHAEFAEAADALAAVAAGRQIPGLTIGGAGARLTADLKDAFSRLAIDGSLAGLDLAWKTTGSSIEARQLGLSFGLRVAPLAVTIKDLGFAAPGGGRFALGASLARSPDGLAAQARLRFDRFATKSYLPRQLESLLGGTLHGGLALSGNIDAKTLAVTALDLALARTRKGPLPRSVRVHGRASASPTEVATSGLFIDVPGAGAALRGRVDLARQLLGVGLRLTAADLPRLLGNMGLPPLARGAALSIDAEGPMMNPRARGDLLVRGISLHPNLPELPELRASFGLADGTLRLDELSGGAFGGKLDGRGQVKLYQHSLEKMLRAPVLDFRLDGKQIDLAELVAVGDASGRLSFTATASGPTNRIRARLALPPGAQIGILGSVWQLEGIEIEADPKSVVLKTAHLRRADGGDLALTGRLGLSGDMPMSWRIVVKDVPLAGLPGMAKALAAGVDVSGTLSADLGIGGTLPRPTLQGEVTLAGVEARGARLGDAKLTLSSTEPGHLSVSGDLFRRFRVAASAELSPAGPRVLGTVSFDKLVLEDLLPELRALDGRGLATGQVRVELIPGNPLLIEARLADLGASISRQATDEDGKTVARRVAVRSAGPMRVVMAGEHIIVDPARLVTDGGELRVRGEIDAETISASASGHVDLELLHPFVRKFVSKLSGDVAAEVKVSGARSRPVFEGLIAISSPIRAKLPWLEPEIAIPSGTVRLDPSGVQLAKLAVAVDDATLTLSGRAGLHELAGALAVSSLDLEARGDVSARLLEQVLPDTVSEAAGRARVEAHVRGTLADPQISARVNLGEIKLRMRGLGRQIAIESGSLELSSHELLLKDVRVRIDDQGVLTIGVGAAAPGRVAIKALTPELKLGSIRLPLRGERLTYRVPDTMEIDDLRLSLELAGDLEAGLALAGEVVVVSGRYVQDFAVRDLVIAPRTNEGRVRPFYAGQPLLEGLGLDLRVRTVGDSFVVQNNLAPEMHMVLDLHVGGTLSNPRIAGDVRPTDGRFHIIGLRGDFELVPNVNHITFVSTKSLSTGDTPELNLEAQNLVTDSSGKDHNVRVRIRGPIGQAAIDLTSDDGLDRNQTMVLLLSGRTTQDVGELGTHNPTLGANVRLGTDMVGQSTRDIVSSLVEPYIDDTMQILTGRRINLRPTVGADGFELKLGARVSRQLDAQLSYLRGFQNQERYRAEGSVWLMDYLTLRGVGERLTISPQQGIVEDLSTARLELTLDFPLRFLRP